MRPVTAPAAPEGKIPVMTDAEFCKAVEGALLAHGVGHPQGVESRIVGVLQRAAGGNGNVVVPGMSGTPRLNTPSAQDMCLLLLEAIRVCLQTQRITLFALNDLDTRLRLQQAGTTNDRPDKQDQTDPAEPLAQGGSQSPDSSAIASPERAQVAGVPPSRPAAKADGNP